jgi:hypothetical protein
LWDLGFILVMLCSSGFFVTLRSVQVFEDLFDKKILFVTGKGGTGKSVITALLGLIAAKQGKRVLIAESHAFDKLSPLFSKAPVGHHETVVGERLSCINLDAKRCFAEYVILHLGMEALYERVFRSQAVTSLLDAIPGLDETMILGRLFHTCELVKDSRYDLLIFDSPASGHFFKLFATPDAILKTGLVGPLIREVQRVKDFVMDPKKAGAVVVTLPEALVMTETLESLPIFNNSIPLHLSAVILNKACPLEEGAFTPAIQSYFDRMRHATVQARKDLLAFLSKEHSTTLQHIYSIPDLGIIEDEIRKQTWDQNLSLIKEWGFDK